MEHHRLGDKPGLVRGRLRKSQVEPAGAGEQRENHFLHRRTHTFSSSSAPERRLCTWLAKSKNRIGLVNEPAVLIHHVVSCAWFWPAAFIFGEWQTGMVNRWCARTLVLRNASSGVNLMLNPVCFKA
jgi:hypothetical protein